MHYFGEKMHKTKVFCIKVKNMLNGESLLFVLCQNVYPFNQNT